MGSVCLENSGTGDSQRHQEERRGLRKATFLWHRKGGPRSFGNDEQDSGSHVRVVSYCQLRGRHQRIFFFFYYDSHDFLSSVILLLICYLNRSSMP